jgi:hypothetical protein
MELPVDEVVPTDEEFEKTQAAQAEQQQAAIQAQMQADQAKLQLEHQFEMEREAAITQRDSQRLNQQAMADVVKQAVQTALQAQQATPESGAGGKKPRKLAFKYGDDGLIAGAEETDE